MKIQTRIHGGEEYVHYYCPGCKRNHSVPSKRWNWNGDFSLPTLSPSVRHFVPADPERNRQEKTFCHYFIRDGKIEFCSDCDHDFSGKTVDMENIKNVQDNS